MAKISRSAARWILLLTIITSTSQQLAAAPPPGTPTATAATSITASSFIAHWGAVSGATSYKLWVGTTSSMDDVLTQYTTSSTSYTVPSLDSGTPYYYRVAAVNASGTSGNSNIISATTSPGVPGIPSAYTAINITATSFLARWGPVPGSTEYRLDVSTVNTFATFLTGFNDLMVTATSQSITGLSSGTNYYYRVRAKNSYGTSSSSVVITAPTQLAGPVASAATGLSATGFVANWATVSGATAYYIDASTSSTFSTFVTSYNNRLVSSISGSTTTSAPVVSLTAGTTYYYRVRATAGVLTDNSNTITALTVPPAPSGMAVTSMSTSFLASWSATSGVATYAIDVSLSKFFTSFVTGYNNLAVSGTSQLVTGLTQNTTYYYQLRAINASGTSASSTFFTSPTSTDAPLLNPATSVTTNSFVASWIGVSGAAKYLIDVSVTSAFGVDDIISTYNSKDISLISGSTSTSAPITSSISPGRAYYYRLRAVTSGGVVSPNSNVMAVWTVPSAPVCPGTTNFTSSSFSANWNAVQGASGYYLDVSASPTYATFLPGFNNLAVTGTNYIVTGLAPATDYYYRVRATNAGGTSINSNQINTSSSPMPPVMSAARNITDHGFLADWADVVGADSYLMEIATDAGFTSIVATSASRTVYATLTSGAFYYIRVRATRHIGASLNSNVVGVQLIPDHPTATAATNLAPTSFTANWSSVAGAIDYKLDVSTSNTFSTYLPGYEDMIVVGTSQDVPGLAANTPYYYRVSSRNNSGSSFNSGTISTGTLSNVPVATAASSITSTSFVANWGVVTGATSYRLDVSSSNTFATFVTGFNNATVSAAAGNHSASVGSGLTSGVGYYYRVRALNAYGTTVSSNVMGVMFAIPVIVASSDYVVGGNPVILDVGAGYDTYSWKNSAGTVLATTQKLSTIGIDTYTVTVTKQGTTGTATYTTRSRTSALNNNNYVLTNTIQLANVIDPVAIDNLTLGQSLESVEYFDGLGRPIQNVVTKGSPAYVPYMSSPSGTVLPVDNLDLVVPIVYDAYGRENRKFLRVASGSDGLYKSNLVPQDFYVIPNDKIADDVRPFSETLFEASPLNRPQKDFAPGNSWFINNKFTERKYLVNQFGTGAGQEKVICWQVNSTTSLPERSTGINTSILAGGYYATGELTVKVTIDEQGSITREYTNKKGNVVLKRSQAIAGSSNLNSLTDWANTYFVYDDLNNISFVLQPELSAIIHQNDSYNPISLDLQKYAFQYKYDGRRRLVEKTLPGTSTVFYVYDNRDRLVLTQDGNQRISNLWLVTKYDVLNRPIVTGFYKHGTTLSQQAMSLLISTNLFAETYNGIAPHGYSTNVVWPAISPDSVLTLTYYDVYNYKSLIGNSSYDYVNTDISGQESSDFSVLTGRVDNMVTGIKLKILDGFNTYLYKAIYYNDRDRPIQTISGNVKGGIDRITNVYDFPGRVINSKTTHVVPGHANQIIAKRFEYDHTARLVNTWHKVNSQPEVLLVHNEYNAVGQLVDKKLHSVDMGASYKQSVDFRFTIGNMMGSINNSQLTNDGITNDETDDLFGMNISYNESSSTGNTPQFNGNISSIKWSQNLALGDIKDVAFNYSYDAMNRLRSTNYVKNTAGVWSNPIGQFNEVGSSGTPGYVYDLNGNIKSLVRKNSLGGNQDDLTYIYDGNRLQTINDAGDLGSGFADGNVVGADYDYDNNGNIIHDKNKLLTVSSPTVLTDAIQYNFLNLPFQVTKNTNESVQYVYDASGAKLSQRTYSAAATLVKTTDYVGDFEYENDVLLMVHHEEGRVLMAGAQPEYQYFLKDHLGDIRLAFTTNTTQDIYTATLETNTQTSEQNVFRNYSHVNFDLFDHTDAGTSSTYAQLLNGASNSQVGLAKSLSVMPGDVVNAEVYAKYLGTSGGSGNLSGFAGALLSAFGLPAPAIGEVGTASAAINSYGAPIAAGGNPGNSSWPKGWLNVLVFDKDYNLMDVAIQQLDASYVQPVGNPTKYAHMPMSRQVTVRQPGYVFIYVSNEGTSQQDIYFDDLKITHTKSPVVQLTDYFPFGLTFNAYQRENSQGNQYLFNNKEAQDELNLGWMDYGSRMYMPEIGRWLTPDPLAEKYFSQSPYHFSGNNPIIFLDKNGEDFAIYFCKDENGKWYLYIVAVYYVQKGDAKSKKSAEAAAKIWNETTNYVWRVKDKKTKTKTDYEIKFDLKVVEVDNPAGEKEKDSQGKADALTKDNSSNVYEVVDDNSPRIHDKQEGVHGETHGFRHALVKDKYTDYVQDGAHEIGHTLGLEHSQAGLMSVGAAGNAAVFGWHVKEIINFAIKYQALKTGDNTRFKIFGDIPKGKVRAK